MDIARVDDLLKSIDVQTKQGRRAIRDWRWFKGPRVQPVHPEKMAEAEAALHQALAALTITATQLATHTNGKEPADEDDSSGDGKPAATHGVR